MENDIIDSENYRGSGAGGEELSFKIIAMRQIQRIISINSKELTKGYWKKSWHAQAGDTLSAYISDGRESYINAIESLHDLVYPRFDEEMKKYSKELTKEADKLLEICIQEGGKATQAEKYRNRKVKIMRKMFQQICLFLERLKWFEEQAIED